MSFAPLHVAVFMAGARRPAAVLLDLVLGEPARGHRLLALGRLARTLERGEHAVHRGVGLLAWMLAMLPSVAPMAWLRWRAWRLSPWLANAFDVTVLWRARGVLSKEMPA